MTAAEYLPTDSQYCECGHSVDHYHTDAPGICIGQAFDWNVWPASVSPCSCRRTFHLVFENTPMAGWVEVIA